MVLERIPVAEMVTSPTKIDESTGGYHHVPKLCQSTFYLSFTSEKNIKKRKGKEQYRRKGKTREEDKIGKETRALQVPCRSETYGYSGENNR